MKWSFLLNSESFPLYCSLAGEVAEWLKAHAWNACIRATVSRVRIPFSPPLGHHDHTVLPLYPTQYNDISKVWLRLFLKRFFSVIIWKFPALFSVCVFRWWGSIFLRRCQTNAHPFQKSRESHFYANDKLITHEEVSFVFACMFVFARMFVWWWDAFRDWNNCAFVRVYR